MQATDDGVTTMRFAAMACEAELTVAGRAPDRRVLDAAAAEVRRIERAYSRYRADSIVSRINAAAGSGLAIEVDAETTGLLDFAARLHAQSDGLFDLTSGILRRAWDFRSGRLPEATALAALRARIGWQKVDWQPAARRIALTEPGMELDFGGFGKEYAADRAAAVLQAGGITSGYVNLGGDLRVLGPRPDGRGWTLGIQHPRDDRRTLAGVEVKSGALATSGDYERYMDIAGRRYCHILDPRTGWPVQHWQSVSVIAPVCLAAGALSTVAMLKGPEAPAFLTAQQVPWLAVDAGGEIVRHRV